MPWPTAKSDESHCLGRVESFLSAPGAGAVLGFGDGFFGDYCGFYYLEVEHSYAGEVGSVLESVFEAFSGEAATRQHICPVNGCRISILSRQGSRGGFRISCLGFRVCARSRQSEREPANHQEAEDAESQSACSFTPSAITLSCPRSIIGASCE